VLPDAVLRCGARGAVTPRRRRATGGACPPAGHRVRSPVHASSMYYATGIAIRCRLGHAPWNVARALRGSGQWRSGAVPLGVRGWEDDSRTPHHRPLTHLPQAAHSSRGLSSPRHRWPVTKSPNPRTASR
jgi:hypothetical protein